MENSVIETNACDPPLINIEILKQNLPSMHDALSLLVRFKPMLLEELDSIERDLDQRDLETVRFHTHRIRSASLYLGLEGVGMAVTRLEQLIEDQAPSDEVMVAWSVARKACRYYLSHDRAEIAALLDGHTKSAS